MLFRSKIAASTPGDSAETLSFAFRSHPIDIQLTLSRSDFEGVILPVVERIRDAAQESLRLAGISPDQVEVLNFTGGTSQVPVLRRAITECVASARVEDQDSFTAVALGLSLPA